MSINVGPTHRVQQLDRMLGMLTVALKVGPAVHNSRAYPVLERLGVLQRDPASWEVSTALSELPWGAQPFEAPPAEPPKITFATCCATPCSSCPWSAAVDSLRTQVQRLDATWQGSGFPTSMLAACSVHY
jgi:hypothetical protein